MINRRKFLENLGVIAGLSMLDIHVNPGFKLAKEQSAVTSRNVTLVSGKDALKTRAFKKGLLFGAACTKIHLRNDLAFASHFKKECNILVAENDLKWRTLRPTPSEFNFAPGDWLVDFSQKNKMLFRGHTLVWHEALPDWFPLTVNKKNADSYLRSHITTVVGRYAGKTHSWDVVNEVIQPRDGQPGGLRATPWLTLLGPSYIDIAFRTAAAADPHALLVLNQNQLEYDGLNGDACRTAVLKLLQQLKSSGTPVHALGIQAHLDRSKNRFNAGKLKKFLSDVASLGLKIMITEMDVADSRLPNDIAVRDQIVADEYNEFLSVVLEEQAVIAVITWGLSDKYTWLAEFKPRNDKAPVRPLPLDEEYNRKPAWDAIASAFDNTTVRQNLSYTIT